MAVQRFSSFFLAIIVVFSYAVISVADPISLFPSQFSGALPPQIPIAFSPVAPALPVPVPTSVAPSQHAAAPQMPALPVPVPTSVAPSLRAAPPQTPIAFPPSLPPLPAFPVPVPISLPPSPFSESPPPPIAFPPYLPSLPPAPISMPPSPPQLPITLPPPPQPVASEPAPSPPSRRGIKGAYWPSAQAESLPPSSIPTPYFTHVFYAFVLVDPTSFQLLITQHDERWMGDFTSTLHSASPPAKALLSIGGAAEGPQNFSNMASDSDNRAAFIQSTIDTTRKYGFDGLDFDWESPSNTQDMSNLALFYKEWRAAVNYESLASGKPRLLLSSAVYFASNFFLPGYVPRTYPGDAIRNYVDFVSPMCYDYHGSWDSSATGALALLYDNTSNVSTSYGISTWIADGVPSEKLVMGMPVYGRTWQLKDPNQHGIGAPAVGTGPGGGLMIYSAILEFNSQNNATAVFDNSTVSAYSYSGTNWIGYDDPTSVQYKVNFAKAQKLGGYFFWALGFDSNWDLARAASEAWDSAN